VKSIVGASVEAGTSAVIELLVQNCQALLSLTEHIIGAWSRLFYSTDDIAALTTTMSTFNSVLDGHLFDATPTLLTVDFIECFALIDSFLLSVQHRFCQCPDIASSSSVALDEVDFIISAAKSQRRDLAGVSASWVKYVAQIQCISRCSTHTSNRSGISGHCTSRASASEFLLVIHAVSGVSAGDGVRVRRDLFTSSLGADRTVNAVGDDETQGASAITRVLNLLRSRPPLVEGREGRGSVYPVEDVFADIQSARVLLSTSITNASTNISGAHFGTAGHAPGTTTAGDLAYQPTPAHLQPPSVSSTPQTSHAGAHKAAYTPSAFNFSSPAVPSSLTHGAAGNAGNIMHRYQAKDQWNCEAVSPLLTCLAGGLSDTDSCLPLAAIVAEWMVSCAMHPLWLDCRHNARKNLFESLVLLLSGAERTEVEGITCPSAMALQYVLVLRIVRAVAEALMLRAAKPVLDLKSLICLVKAALAGTKLSVRYRQELNSRCAAGTGTSSSEGDNDGLSGQAWEELWALELRGLTAECGERLRRGIQYYQEVFPRSHPFTPADLLRMEMAASKQREPSSPARRTKSTEALLEASLALDTTVSSDEFSDWDEDSDADEEQVHLTDLDATAATRGLTLMFYDDSAALCEAITDWV
jgi:hypothetical protein